MLPISEVRSVTQSSYGLINISVYGSHNESTVNLDAKALDPKVVEALMQGLEKSQVTQREALQSIPEPLAVLGDNIKEFKKEYEKSLKGKGEWDVLSMYVPVQGIKKGRQGKEKVDLEAELERFFASEATVFLLQGVAGTGKSTFNRHLALKKLEDYQYLSQTQSDPPLVFFVELRSVDNPNKEVIQQFLQSQGFVPEQIELLRTHPHQRCIFIFDGYDEIKEKNRNFYDLNELWRWENAKFVITSRPEYLDTNYQTYFCPKGTPDGFREAWMASFSAEQRSHYIQNYVDKTNPPWTVEQYEQALNQLSTLGKDLERPIVLRMLLQILPELKERDQTGKALTLGAVYEEYFQQWWGNWQSRLGAIALTYDEEKARHELCERRGGFIRQGFAYIQNCALELTKVGLTSVQDSEDFKKRYQDVYEAFFTDETKTREDARKRLLRFNAPFQIKQKQHYEFSHKSMQEYLVARTIWGPDYGAMEINGQDVLNQLSLVKEPVILDFLVEQVKERAQFKAYLRAWIEASKAPDAVVTVGAANAITILVRAGVQFNGEDLKGIRISGADLSYGVFDSAQLQGADLSEVKFLTSWLRQANLSGAQMSGVQFGEWAYLQEESVVNSCAYSPDGKTCTVGLKNDKIHVYNTSSWAKIHTLQGDAMMYSPNGSQIATRYSWDGIRLWDTHTGVAVHTLDTLRGDIMMYSPNGSQIATRGSWNEIQLWNTHTGAAVHTLQGHTHNVTSVVYSPNGAQIASGSDDKTIRLWDAHTGVAEHALQGHDHEVKSIVYSPDGAQIASSDDKTIRLWDAHTGVAAHALQGHDHEIKSIVYSPDGAQIASSDDKTIRLWDAHTGVAAHALQGHDHEIKSIVYSPDGVQIASSDDKTIRLWDAHTGAAVHTLKGHTGKITVVYSPSGEQLASFGSTDHTVQLWSASSGVIVRILQGHTGKITSVVYSPSGRQLASGSDDKTVRLWDTAGTILRGHADEVTSVTYSPKGDSIALGCNDKTVRLWDAHTGAAVNALQGHTDRVRSVVYSPGGAQIASGSDDKTVRLWDVVSGETAHILKRHVKEVTSVVYSPSGEQLASGSKDNTVRLWNASSGAVVRILQGHIGWVQSVAYSPCGSQIASGSTDKTVRLWETAGPILQNHPGIILRGHTGSVKSVMYSPKGDQIASSSGDKTVRLWNVHTGAVVRTLQGHTDGVRSVVYSPDGAQIASGSADRTVRLWEVASGTCLRVIQEFTGSVDGIAWKETLEGSYLLTGSKDKSVRQWEIKKEEKGYKVTLCWSTGHEVLTVQGTLIEGVDGLSEANEKLLKQRGALLPESRDGWLDFFQRNFRVFS